MSRFHGIPVYEDPDIPLHKMEDQEGPPGVPWVCIRVRVAVSHVLTNIPGQRPAVLVHPDRMALFLEVFGAES